ISPERVQTNVSLADISNWRVGGIANVLIQPRNIDEIIQLRKIIAECGLPSIVIGNTTNLLFSDENIEAIFLQITNEFAEMALNDDLIIANAGVWVPRLARFSLQAGLT